MVDLRIIRFPFARHDVQGKRVAGECGFAISSLQNGRCVSRGTHKRCFAKAADRITVESTIGKGFSMRAFFVRSRAR
jgi:hypothetical protein